MRETKNRKTENRGGPGALSAVRLSPKGASSGPKGVAKVGARAVGEPVGWSTGRISQVGRQGLGGGCTDALMA